MSPECHPLHAGPRACPPCPDPRAPEKPPPSTASPGPPPLSGVPFQDQQPCSGQLTTEGKERNSTSRLDHPGRTAVLQGGHGATGHSPSQTTCPLESCPGRHAHQRHLGYNSQRPTGNALWALLLGKCGVEEGQRLSSACSRTLSSTCAGRLPGGLPDRRRATLLLPSSPDPTQP